MNKKKSKSPEAPATRNAIQFIVMVKPGEWRYKYLLLPEGDDKQGVVIDGGLFYKSRRKARATS